ncbi:hypothetical protein AXE65_05820 [Ventosimonas gracilis]|uniref:Pyocin R2, holin n=1 Tax=Ventosimonas gracilis TaxID=1680762 RepID=A0A139SN06_9GAMM|nr:phage holin family protein [Ventosimonas gracilis]KXU35860.1 hypothetical protein AXE65_05820 [Ventosimonas gracilis]
MPASQHQTLSDLPLWLFPLAFLAGLFGETWRAEAAGLAFGDLIKRALLRCGASSTFGMCAGMLAMAYGAHPLMAGALTGMVAVGGADIASALYSRWLKRKLRMCDDEPA